MQSSSSSSRIGALITFVGAALSILGFFLPMFTEGNPQVPGSTHPVYEWQAVTSFPSSIVWVGCIFAALPLLGMLIVLVASGMTLYRVAIPRLALLQRLAAGWGLTLQILFSIFVFMLFLIGYNRTDIAIGFVVLPIGFAVMLIGTWSGALRPQTIFTSLTCIFLAIGSVILSLGWLINGSFFRMFIAMFILLPTMFLIGESGLLMAKQWITAALVLPLERVCLAEKCR